MKTRVHSFLLVWVLAAIPAHAATIGSLPSAGTAYFSRPSNQVPLTLIDTASPATEAGTVTTATVRWEGAPTAGCPNAFKLKFLRSATAEGDGYQVFDERGPFTATNGFITVSLTPPVQVFAGEVIGVTQLLTTSCGGVSAAKVDSDRVMATSSIDPPAAVGGAPLTTTSLLRGYALAARATSDPSDVVGYVTVAGATAGGFGSQFKTGLQLTNPDSDRLNGRLIFHPAGAAGSASDPAIEFSLGPFQTLSYENVMTNFNRTGLGSIDVVTTSSAPPIVTSRVYSDAGTAGTSGFVQEMVGPQSFLGSSERAILPIPADLTNFRVNIGVRTLGAGATVNVSTLNAAGNTGDGPFTRTYAANFFEQVALGAFINNATLPAGGALLVQVTAGNAIFYGTTNDNRTNDPSIQFFKRR